MEQPYQPNSGAGFGGMPPMGPPPKNWLVESILVTIFCCLPFGIVGIIKAAEVNSKMAAGDYAGAQESSQAAGKWTKIGFFVSLAGGVIYGLLLAFGIGSAVMSGMTGAH
ncbi:CD225/dispanin family protein [Hymenobacter ruricola]|uniref:CD225/dispanin family protein n=1 Tax=Hymenobacter ruricola TaxID=2791023 RepID=A0ABS0IA37_9BACT|nr:CD225/dispanin family protein [Hymenobacter ruricola]MBF9223842.1 CD225/dispanin family protein [Hymenobacter ruricola]